MSHDPHHIHVKATCYMYIKKHQQMSFNSLRPKVKFAAGNNRERLPAEIRARMYVRESTLVNEHVHV